MSDDEAVLRMIAILDSVAPVLVETMALTGADVSGDRGVDPADIVARAGGLLAYCRRLREEVAELADKYSDVLMEAGRLSLHAEALVACDVPRPAMSDRELAVLLLDAVTCDDHRGRMSRAGHLAGVALNGSGVREGLLRVAGIDPDEETGWDGEGECPTCGSGAEEWT